MEILIGAVAAAYALLTLYFNNKFVYALGVESMASDAYIQRGFEQSICTIMAIFWPLTSLFLVARQIQLFMESKKEPVEEV